jgi:DNA repair exonuclease SbcCD nuclease subunit
MKILHLADLHIREKNIEEIATVMQFIIDRAEAEKVDLIVIAGDAFDSRDIKLDSRAAKLAIQTISALADIAPVAVVVGTPSHDGTAPEVLRYARGKYTVHVSSAPEQIFLTDGDLRKSPGTYVKPSAVLTMIPQFTKQYFNSGSITESNESISQAMNGIFAGFGSAAAPYERIPHVLIGHWNVSGARLSTGQTLTGQDIDISVDQMSLTGASAHLLGHIHMPQQMGDRTFYGGSPYPLTWGETEDKGFWLHEFDADDLYKSEFVKTPCRKLIRFAYDMTAGEEVSVSLDNVRGASVRVDITTWQDEAVTIEKDVIRTTIERAGALDADIRIIRIPRQTVRSESVLKVETLRDKLIAMAALKDETVPESILEKADELEARQVEDVVRRAA